jgi:hypothetical protein
VSTMTKVFVVLSAVISIALSAVFIAFAAQVYNWKALAAEYQTVRDAAVTELQAERAASQAALTMKDQALVQRGQLLRDAQRQIDDVNERLAKARTDAAQAENERLNSEAGRTKLQELLDLATARLNSLEKEVQVLHANNRDLQTRYANANGRLIRLTTDNTILTEELRNARAKLYAAEQQVASLQSGAAWPRGTSAAPSTPGVVAVSAPVRGEIRGQITEVRGSYAGVNVGESSGVVVGLEFMIYRDGTYLGELTIESVRPSESGGRITSQVEGEIRAGDQIVYGLN